MKQPDWQRHHFLAIAMAFALSALWSGCSTATKSELARDRSKEGPTTIAEVIGEYKEPESDSATSGNPTLRPGVVVSVVTDPVRGRVLRNNRFDYPVVVNDAVEQWIDYFTGKGRKHFEKYLLRSRYFIPTIARTLKSHGMPQDLVYLAMIESGFNNVARSHASAVGPWQFIRSTGRLFGLNINYWVDERRDTRKSTLAAIAYLKKLYQEFGSWELSAASYNAGENKLRRAVAKYRTKDFWQISRNRFLRKETRHYVPKIMAAAILTKNPELFGFEDPFSDRGSNPTLAVEAAEPTPKDLGEESQDPTELKEVLAEDPAEGKGESPRPPEVEEEDETFAAEVEDQDQESLETASSMFMVANPNEQIVEFEIKGPADLFAVAKAAGISFSAVKMLNPELLRWCTPPAMKAYRIRLPASSKDSFLAQYNNDRFERRVVFASYKVRKGETVAGVARRFTIHPDPIRELNHLGAREDRLFAGREIILPIPTGYKRVIASLYDEKPMPSRKKRRHRVRRSRSRHVDRGSMGASGTLVARERVRRAPASKR